MVDGVFGGLKGLRGDVVFCRGLEEEADALGCGELAEGGERVAGADGAEEARGEGVVDFEGLGEGDGAEGGSAEVCEGGDERSAEGGAELLDAETGRLEGGRFGHWGWEEYSRKSESCNTPRVVLE